MGTVIYSIELASQQNTEIYVINYLVVDGQERLSDISYKEFNTNDEDSSEIEIYICIQLKLDKNNYNFIKK